MKGAPAADIRRRELAMIHMAKAELRMADDTYRDLLWTVGRVRSSADLDWVGRKKLLEHLRACGWKPRPAAKARPTRPMADDAQSKKIRAMWLALHGAGVVRDSSERALASYVKRQTRVEALEWLHMDQAEKVIEALKKWAHREGLLGPDGVVESTPVNAEVRRADAERLAAGRAEFAELLAEVD